MYKVLISLFNCWGHKAILELVYDFSQCAKAGTRDFSVQ